MLQIRVGELRKLFESQVKFLVEFIQGLCILTATLVMTQVQNAISLSQWHEVWTLACIDQLLVFLKKIKYFAQASTCMHGHQ